MEFEVEVSPVVTFEMLARSSVRSRAVLASRPATCLALRAATSEAGTLHTGSLWLCASDILSLRLELSASAPTCSVVSRLHRWSRDVMTKSWLLLSNDIRMLR